MKEPIIYVSHIRDAIALIEEFTINIDKKGLEKSKLIQSAVFRQIEIMGEASKNVSSEFRKKHENIPWSKIAGMRDMLIHQYFSVDTEKVWDVIRNDLPKLKTDIQKILQK